MPVQKGRKRLRRTIRLAQLELLAAMEHAPTLSAAARAAQVTQPAASRLLRTLSVNLGIDLFERSGRSLRATLAGRALLQRAAGLIADLDRIETELEAIDSGLVGSVSLGAGVAAGYVLIPRAISRLRKVAPKIAVQLREGPMEELLARLREGRIDLLVGRFEEPGAATRDLITEPLYDPAMAVVCGPQHALAHKRAPAWADIFAQPWILPEPGTPMRTGIEQVFAQQHQRPVECLIESSSIQANVGLLNSDNLLWVLSEDIARYFVDLGLLRIVALPKLRGPAAFVLAHSAKRRPSPAAQRVVECLRAAARGIPSGPATRRRTVAG